MNMGDALAFEISFQSEKPTKNPIIGLIISSIQGEKIINVNNIYLTSKLPDKPLSCGIIRCDLGILPLTDNRYNVALWLGGGGYEFQHIDWALSFEVIGKDLWGTGKTPPVRVSSMWWPAKIEVLPLSNPS